MYLYTELYQEKNKLKSDLWVMKQSLSTFDDLVFNEKKLKENLYKLEDENIRLSSEIKKWRDEAELYKRLNSTSSSRGRGSSASSSRSSSSRNRTSVQNEQVYDLNTWLHKLNTNKGGIISMLGQPDEVHYEKRDLNLTSDQVFLLSDGRDDIPIAFTYDLEDLVFKGKVFDGANRQTSLVVTYCNKFNMLWSVQAGKGGRTLYNPQAKETLINRLEVGAPALNWREYINSKTWFR